QINAPKKGRAAGGSELRSGYALPAFQAPGILILIDAALSSRLSPRTLRVPHGPMSLAPDENDLAAARHQGERVATVVTPVAGLRSNF
ncbi:MAG: hypothetical protein RB191_22855, partial [Terriglobia bacterium]|nr:hypothetical protein [Terriglobia bacterium]